tara:strand:+ start:470 stop:589 length:120 start_codon:yes stop_codon:yes gene_type:complete
MKKELPEQKMAVRYLNNMKFYIESSELSKKKIDTKKMGH